MVQCQRLPVCGPIFELGTHLPLPAATLFRGATVGALHPRGLKSLALSFFLWTLSLRLFLVSVPRLQARKGRLDAKNPPTRATARCRT